MRTTFCALSLASIGCQGLSDAEFEGNAMGVVRGALTAPIRASNPKVAILWTAKEPESSCTGLATICGSGIHVATEALDDRKCWQPCIDMWGSIIEDFDDGTGGGATRCPTQEELVDVISCTQACEGVTYEYPTPTYATCNGTAVGTTVAIESDLSGAFALHLYDAPPSAALSSAANEPRVAIGIITLLNAPLNGPLANPQTGEFSQDYLGVVESKAIVYAADPIPADSRWGNFLGGAYEIGYHLVDIRTEEVCSPDGPCEPYDFLARSPGDLQTKLALQVGSRNIPGFFFALYTDLQVE